MAAIGISRREVGGSEWAACVAARACRALPQTRDGRIVIADPNLAAPYFRWLAAKTGRSYHVPRADEWELVALASGPSGGLGVETMLDSMTEWVCIATPRSRRGDCIHGRRGASGKPCESLAGSERVVGLRLIETLAAR
jgi:hypothetical protein